MEKGHQPDNEPKPQADRGTHEKILEEANKERNDPFQDKKDDKTDDGKDKK